MRGHFDVAVKDAGGLRDEDFLAAKEEGRLCELLDKLNVVQRAKCDNMLMHYLTNVFQQRIIAHSFPQGPWPIYSGNIVPFNNVSLMVTDAEPAYSDAYGWYGSMTAHFDNIGVSSGAKYWGSTAESWVFAKTLGGKEEIYGKFRWLWLPSEGNSNNIRSLGIFGSEYVNASSSEDRYLTGRVRLKDPNTGLPVILIKNFNQVLVIEYTVFLVTL